VHGAETADNRYLNTIRESLAVCLRYHPKFGKGGEAGYSLEEFYALYRGDNFYSWFGLDSPLVYAAHRAAGGITSLYRQIGLACEKVLLQAFQDHLGLTAEQATWSYTVKAAGGKRRRLALDGRISLDDIADAGARDRVERWLRDAAEALELRGPRAKQIQGAVFEIRQGYKSKDANRQNADMANAANAYAHSFVPVVALLSTQIDDDIAERYARARWLLLRGTVGGTWADSTYAFCREALGYDMAGFFQRHSETLRRDVRGILEALLR